MNKARELVEKSIPMGKLEQNSKLSRFKRGFKTSRIKRGFKPLGELVAFLTDMPSPSAWEGEQNLINILKNVIRGTFNETQMLEHTVKDEADIINGAINEISKIVHVQFKINNEITNFQFYLNSQHKVGQICFIGNLVADRLVEEARIINQIREKSRTNSPSEYLFPIKEIFLKTKFLNAKTHQPIFNSEHEIEQVYSMSSAVTTIDSYIIYSVLNIPLVDYSQKFDFIAPTLTKNEVDIITKLSTLALAPIDTFLCAKHNTAIP